MKRLFLLTTLLIAGCAGGSVTSMDRAKLTDFTPTGPGTFRYRGVAEPIQYPLETPAGEASRMAMLDEWIGTNRYCARGYDIVSRQVLQRDSRSHDVHYEGRCRA